MTKLEPPLSERVSWPFTFAHFYISNVILLGLMAAFGLLFAWTSLKSRDWIDVATGLLLALAMWPVSRRIGGLYDVWRWDETLILSRGRTRLEVPLDRVTKLEIPVRATFGRVVSLYWKDDAGVERRVRFGVTDSTGWRALFQRLTNGVTRVQVLTD